MWCWGYSLIVSGVNQFNKNARNTGSYVYLCLAGLQQGGSYLVEYRCTGQKFNTEADVWDGSVCGGVQLSQKRGQWEEAALKIKQFPLYPSTRNEGWAEVVHLHLLLTANG